MLTLSDLDQFNRFARERIEGREVQSLGECVRLWREEQGHQASVAALRESLEDVAAGRTNPAAQVEEEIRREFGLPPRARTEQPS